MLSYPAPQAVHVDVEVDPSLVETYNARHNTSWTMLDAKYYELSDSKLTIPAGKTISDVVTLKLKISMARARQKNFPLTRLICYP